jgi:hypothetical protein
LGVNAGKRFSLNSARLHHQVSIFSFWSRSPAVLPLLGSSPTPPQFIFRRALQDTLPDELLWRTKAKFWDGAGVGTLLEQHANETISDADFSRERHLPNDWQLNTKEELLYYRIFKEHFGEFDDLAWMGRTKGAPRA